MAGDNKKMNFDPPTRLLELTQNLIRLSHDHSTSSLKISCKSVQPFSHVADKETKKERKKSPENNTPSPYRGRGRVFAPRSYNIGNLVQGEHPKIRVEWRWGSSQQKTCNISETGQDMTTVTIDAQ